MTPDSNSPTAPSGTRPEVDWMGALDEHRSSLRRLVAAKLNGQGESAVDDVLQEVAIATQSSGGRGVEPSKAGAWLRQVAMRKVADYWRGMGRQRRLHNELTDAPETDATPADSPYEWVVRMERGRSVADALGTLPEDDRVILEQKYLHGRSYEDIARSLGISLKALEYRLTRARRTMRRHLESHDHSQQPIS